MNLNIRRSIWDSGQIVKDALEGYVEATQYSLEKDLGKRCSERFIRKQMQPQTDISYLNFVAVFKLWISAIILSGNRRGAELIIAHIEIFIRDVKNLAKGTRTEFPIVSEKEKNLLLQSAIANLRILQEA